MNRFEGKVVAVTGAGSGIGAGTASHFFQEGGRITRPSEGAVHPNGVPTHSRC